MNDTENLKLPILYYGLVGGHRSGKSTFAKKLAAEMRDRYPRLLVIEQNYADPLRGEAGKIWPYELGPQKKHPLEREVLQATGEVWRRVDSLHWVYASLRDIEDRIDEEEYIHEGQFDAVLVIAADVYHINEALILDRLLIVDNVENDVAPPKEGEYQPASIQQTNWMIRNWQTVREMMVLSGGSVRSLRVESPAGLANAKTVDSERVCLEVVLSGKMDAVGQPPLERIGPEPRLDSEPVFGSSSISLGVPMSKTA